MSVYRKTNSPFRQIDFQVDNVRYRFSSETTSEAEAKRIEARAIKEARRRSIPGRGLRDCTFDQAAFLYWDLVGQATRDANNLKGNMRRTVLMVGTETPCSTIDLEKILTYRRDLRTGLTQVPALKGGRKPKIVGYKPATVNKYLSLVFLIVGTAERVLKTKFPDLPRPSDEDEEGHGILEILRPRQRYLTVEEEKRLEKVSEPDLKDMWKVDLELGLRETNLCELRWSEIDWAERIITVETKATGGSPLLHSVYLSDDAWEILKRREARSDAHPEFVFTLPSRASTWFEGKLRKTGQQIPVSRTLFYERMREAYAAAGIKNIIVHDLRRTAARRIYEEDDLHAAQVFLGHRDIMTTADYIGLDTKDLAKAMAKRSQRNRARLAALDHVPNVTETVPTAPDDEPPSAAAAPKPTKKRGKTHTT